jgi:hypothetical protein
MSLVMKGKQFEIGWTRGDAKCTQTFAGKPERKGLLGR